MKRDAIAHELLKGTDTLKELLLIYLAVILTASGFFSYYEDMKFFDAVWMAFVTATSTGFGDFYPKTVPGRITAVWLMHVTLFLIIPLIVARLLTVAVKNDDAFTHNEQEQIKQKLDEVLRKLQ